MVGWPADSALGWLRQNDHEFRASLRCTDSSRPAGMTQVRMVSKRGCGWQEAKVGVSSHGRCGRDHDRGNRN